MKINRDLTNVKIIGNDQDGYKITRIDSNPHDMRRMGPKDPFATLEDAETWCAWAKWQIKIHFFTTPEVYT